MRCEIELLGECMTATQRRSLGCEVWRLTSSSEVPAEIRPPHDSVLKSHPGDRRAGLAAGFDRGLLEFLGVVTTGRMGLMTFV